VSTSWQSLAGSWKNCCIGNSVHSILFWTCTSKSCREDQFWVQGMGISDIPFWSRTCSSSTHPPQKVLGQFLQICFRCLSLAAVGYISCRSPAWTQIALQVCERIQGTLLPTMQGLHPLCLTKHPPPYSHHIRDNPCWSTCLLCSVDN
jgi:hypothetical protein